MSKVKISAKLVSTTSSFSTVKGEKLLVIGGKCFGPVEPLQYGTASWTQKQIHRSRTHGMQVAVLTVLMESDVLLSAKEILTGLHLDPQNRTLSNKLAATLEELYKKGRIVKMLTLPRSYKLSI